MIVYRITSYVSLPGLYHPASELYKYGKLVDTFSALFKEIGLIRAIFAWIGLKFFKYSGIAQDPYIVLEYPHSVMIFKHETVHIAQQRIDGKLKFYCKYALEFIKNLLRFCSFFKAYYNISYEVQARELALVANSSKYVLFLKSAKIEVFA